ncbi:hypothetical protein PPYR_08837 [Photinus pyralis]|uniref:Multidrug resistance-associated protein lethal(2)03659 n=2 Tax=Photinus pyralis TaxID=7054 RepID=A0A5N4AKL2_PHOPY|nr:hypothetical protein PPYR_08837 [Photinus pyralis]
MYVWEKPIQNLVTYVRRLECKWIRLLNFTKATYMTVDIILIPILLCTTIGVYVQHNEITAAKVFSLIVFYNSLRLPMAWFFPQALSLLAEALVSVDRISSFLINEEVNMQLTKNADKSVAVNITNGVAGWDEDVILRDINVTIKRGSLVAIMGQVGCGKSSLINVILKELPLTSGEILINGKISFASQEPWLFCGSVRDNILFGEEMDTARYNEVVRSCSLECDFNLLPFGDRTLVGGRGASLSGGQKARISLARAVYREADIYLLDEPFSAVDVRVGQQIYQEGIKSFLKRKTVILVTQQLQYLRDADQVIELDNGTLISSKQWKKKDTDDPQECFDAVTTAEVPTIDKVVEEIRSHSSVSRNVYVTYFAFGGNICHNAIMWAFLLLSQALMSGGSYYLAYWVNQVDYGSVTTKSVSDEEIHFYIYASITLACVIMTSFASYLFYALCLKSSKQLHDNMLNSILQAPMRFFNTNPQGQITNRFSQDTEIVDIQLPTVTLNALQLTLGMIASVVLVAYVNSWFLILVVAVSSCIYLIQAFCVKTIRNIKRMENITRSPVLEHISSSLQGLSTIRAFGAEEIVRREFDCHQNLHICCGEIFISTTQAFASLLDYTCAIYVVIVTITLTAFDNGILGGNFGLALTQCLQLTTILQWSVRQATDVETHMASTERIMEYKKIDHERNLGGRIPPRWPSNGEITFNNVCLKYSQQDLPVLKNLTFKIASKEKVGIVGRTGAGKSSIVSALFRFSHITGQILVDGVDTEQLNLKELRTKISIIPQNPVIFSGTLRRNLDPMQVIEDSKLWSALEDVELKDFFSGLPLGLDFVFEQGGLNVSVGQRQLICLARVILRKNKILVLDEATASIDRETDYLVQRAIRKRFADCTVISIAHRIETIMDCDRVMVMDAGELVEFDAPSVLLQNVNGHFYRTAQQACKGNKLARQQL